MTDHESWKERRDQVARYRVMQQETTDPLAAGLLHDIVSELEANLNELAASGAQLMVLHDCALGVLRGNGRMSRHYYDVHRLMGAPVGKAACIDNVLTEDCLRHARMFFYRGNTGLDVAKRGSFKLRPTKPMLDPLRSDYEAMAGMIFGEVPSFEKVLESVAGAEELINDL